MKVLIIKLSSIGDVIQTLPALYALRKGFEKKGVKAGGDEPLRIDWLVEEASSTVLSGNPLIDNVIIVRNRGWKTHFRENIKTARMLASVHYDMALDFQGLLKSGVWVWLSKGRRRIGFSNARELSAVFLNEKAPPYDPDKHAVDRYLDLAVYAGGEGGEAVFPLYISGEEKNRAQAVLKGGGISDKTPFFVIASRARWRTKQWNDGAFAEAAKAITEKTGMRAVLVGGLADRAGLDGLKERIGKMGVNLAGHTTLKELAALMKMSRFVLAVDSGPMHMASAVGVPVVALFGPTAPRRTGPYGGKHIIITKELKCSPCFKKICPDARCMMEITAQEVVRAVEKMLER